MTRKRKTKGKRKRKTRSFNGRPYKRVDRVFPSKREAQTRARNHRKRKKGNRARVVKAASGGWLVFTNPCKHSRWHYIHKATKARSLKEMKGRAASEARKFAKGYEEYLTRGY